MDARESRIAIEVLEVAEEACIDVLDVILGHYVIGIAVGTVDGIELDAAGTDGRCRRNFFLNRREYRTHEGWMRLLREAKSARLLT